MKTNKFFASAVVGLIATVLSNLLANILNNFSFQHSVSMSAIAGIFALMNMVEIFLSMLIGLIIYCKLILKSEVPISKLTVFSVVASVINVILSSFIRLPISVLRYILDFIVLTAFTAIVFTKLDLFQDVFYDENGERKVRIKNGKYYPSFWIIVVIGYIISTAASVCVIGFINEWDYTVEAVIGLVLGSLILSVVYTYIYFLPYLIANKKKHRQIRAIYILNIFAGWTIIAWIVSLVWACTESSNEKIIQQTIQSSSADELMKYKTLLDSGVITQEEFDNKKAQLLQFEK